MFARQTCILCLCCPSCSTYTMQRSCQTAVLLSRWHMLAMCYTLTAASHKTMHTSLSTTTYIRMYCVSCASPMLMYMYTCLYMYVCVCRYGDVACILHRHHSCISDCNNTRREKTSLEARLVHELLLREMLILCV